MNNDEVVHAVQDAPMPRRDFLRKSILLALPATFGGFVAPAAAAIAMSSPLPATLATPAFSPPSRVRGSAVRNVRDYGAVGNDGADDTTAFQNAINSLPSSGGTVYVPAGNYKIDVLRSVKLRSRMHLKMHPDAKLIARAVSYDEYVVVLADGVSDVEISGGQIVGERYSHVGTSGNGGGHGIRIRGSEHVTIRDVHISDCWGDGITVGPKSMWKAAYKMSRDVVIYSVVCTRNRRNALAIGNVVGIKVYDSEFSNTSGTTPQCGIDVEPDDNEYGGNYCDNVHIENCIIAGNAKNGLNIWRLARGITAKNCFMQDNVVCGIFTQAAKNVTLIGNTVRRNGSTGAALRKNNHNYDVYNNTFYNNYTKQGPNPREAFWLTGTAPKVQKDINVSREGSTGMNIGRNYYR